MIKPDYRASVEFLEKWSPEGIWSLVAIRVDRGKVEGKCFSPDERDDVIPWLEIVGSHSNLYFTVNPLIRAVDKKPNRENIKELAWLHVDVDPASDKDVKEEQARILDLFSKKRPQEVPQPTCVLFSGGGYQAFWRLDYPFKIEGQEERYEQAKRWNVQLEQMFGGDHCHNVDRIMRLPGTINRPNDKKRAKGRVEALAEVIWFGDEEYGIGEFVQAPDQSGPGLGFSGNKIKISGNLERVSLGELSGVKENVLHVIEQGTDPEDPTRWDGDRSKAVWYVLTNLHKAGIDPEKIFAVITDPDYHISEHVNSQPNPEKYAIRQIERSAESAVAPELAELNESFAVIGNIGGKCRVMSEYVDAYGAHVARNCVSYQTFSDFRNRMMNRLIEWPNKKGDVVSIPLGEWWLKNSLRRQYEGVIFSPGKDVANHYNLWRGFSYKAEPGDCSLFLEHTLENICSGNEKHYEYLLNWMAHAVQNPASQGHSAIVLKGAQGTGKGKFVSTFGALFGQHFIHVTNPRHLVGNFNSHLQDCLILFADEAFWGGDKKNEGVLKAIITEPTLMIEQKGVDSRSVPNYIHLIMASNEDWVVPVGAGDRRFLVLDVNNDRKEDSSYFAALQRQMENGGYEALLFMLLARDLNGYNPRLVPKTKAHYTQKVLSLSPMQEWWFDKLNTGEIIEGKGWPAFVATSELRHDFISYSSSFGTNARSNGSKLGSFLKTIFPDDWKLNGQLSNPEIIKQIDGTTKRVERPRVYRIPGILQCREIWTTMFGPTDWEDPMEMDNENDIDKVFNGS